jgi:hypothetical protein
MDNKMVVEEWRIIIRLVAVATPLPGALSHFEEGACIFAIVAVLG